MKNIILILILIISLTSPVFADYVQAWGGVGEISKAPMGNEPGVFGFDFGIMIDSHDLGFTSGALLWSSGLDAAPGFVFGWSGFRYAIEGFSIGVGAGAYGHFSNQYPDLNNLLIFRLDAQLSIPTDFGYVFIGYVHLSNARLGATNPATEFLTFGFGFIL